MSSAGISFGGLGSGLDTRAIISALVAVEERPIRALESKKTVLGRQKSLFGELRTLLDKLRSASQALKTTTDFLRMRATSDDDTILTAVAGSAATPGTYAVKVEKLARAQVNSTGRASPTQNLGGPASLQIDVGGNTHLIAIDSPNLQSIAASINAYDTANSIGIRAEVIDTGNPANGGAQRYELVVRSTRTGSAGAFAISYDDGSPEFATLIDDLAAGQRTAAQDAELLVNDIRVFRSSNTIADLFPGITLDLRSDAQPQKLVTVTVNTDAEQTNKKVRDLIDAYNEIVGFFSAQNALDADGKAKGPLFGDPTLRSLRSSLRAIAGGTITGTGNPAYQLLSQAGITADTQGKLTFDQAKFESALGDDEQAVAALFAGGANGLAARLEAQINVYTDTVEGLLKVRTDGFDRLTKQTQDRIDQARRRLDLYEQQLTAKYSNLETLLARLQGQGSSIANITRRSTN